MKTIVVPGRADQLSEYVPEPEHPGDSENAEAAEDIAEEAEEGPLGEDMDVEPDHREGLGERADAEEAEGEFWGDEEIEAQPEHDEEEWWDESGDSGGDSGGFQAWADSAALVEYNAAKAAAAAGADSASKKLASDLFLAARVWFELRDKQLVEAAGC